MNDSRIIGVQRSFWCGLGGALIALSLCACAEPTKPSTAVPTPAAEQGQAYQIQPGDKLLISVWREEETLLREVFVQPNGGVSFPLAGHIQAEGMSIKQIEEQLEKRLSEFISEPAVSVSLVESLGNRIYIVGKVNRPGEYVISRPVDVMQALALAGGLTPFAEQDQIKILR